MLGQDESKKLAVGKASDKYDFYLRASGLKMVLSELKLANDYQEEMKKILEGQEGKEQSLQDAYEKFKKEHDDAQEQYVLQEKQVALQKQLVWSNARAFRVQREEIAESVDTCSRDRDTQAAAADEQQSKSDALEPELKELEEDLSGFAQKAKEEKSQLEKVVAAINKAKQNEKAKKKALDRLVSDQKSKQNDIKSIDSQIAELQRPAEDGPDASTTKLVQEKEDKQREISDLAAETKALVAAREGLHKGIYESQQKEGHLPEEQKRRKQQLDMHQKAVREEETKLTYLQKQGGSNDLVKFGADIAKLMGAVKKNEKKFKHTPVGPVGAYLELKDPKWTTAVEAAMGPTSVRTILVGDWKDHALLKNLMKSNRIKERDIQIQKRRLDDEDFAKSGRLKTQHFPDAKYTTVHSALTVTNTAVQNYLYDKQVYQMGLFEDRGAAIAAVWGANPPKNLRQSFDPAGDKYETKGQAQIQSGYKQKGPKVLGVDMADAVRAQQQKVDAERKELDVAADRHDQIAEQRSLLQAETKKIEAEVKKNEAAEKKLHMKEAKIARSIRDIENQMDAQETVQATQADEVCPRS